MLINQAVKASSQAIGPRRKCRLTEREKKFKKKGD
jgi:hypothetical protein